MDLLCITDASKRFDVSSKTLRYYENVGLLKSTRMEDNKYRYYDAEAIERIKQILILRKMQIPIKDIIRIYENEDMSTVVEVFVERINAIDEQVGALSELKNITNEFLQTMLKNGITKISTLPLLYEEMDKQLTVLEERKPTTYKELSAVSEKLQNGIDISIVDLPPMRMLTSIRKDNDLSDVDGFNDWIALHDFPRSLPGNHEMFEYQDNDNDIVFLRKIDETFEGESPFLDIKFEGGLFAVSSVYIDDDIGAFHRLMINSFDTNPYYKVDYKHDGSLRNESLLETVISPDDKREKVNIYLAVKKRLPNETLYDPIELIENISIDEIEKANPILWTKDFAISEKHPFITWHRISTDIKVKLPFRVDFVFMLDDSTVSYASGSEEGSIIVYHGKNLYGVNKGNYTTQRDESITFNQPIFGNTFLYKKIGHVDSYVDNRVTWIVGKNHLAVIINGEVRYCGVNFPYMKTEWQTQQAQNISIGSGSSGKKYIKSVKVSQLKEDVKYKIKKGALIMNTRQSNNIIPIIHQLITSDHGENYWFNGCAKYVMECLGEPDYDYWFFAGLTGDNLAQNYAKNGSFLGDGVSDFMATAITPKKYYEDIFRKCGYASTYVDRKELHNNTEMYVQTLTAYIDKGVPIILYREKNSFGVFVGYEEHGKTLLFITGNDTEPQRMPLENAIGNDETEKYGWIFVGEKIEQKELKQLYRDVVKNLPKLLTTETDTYCFGVNAFRTWAEEIENGRFDGLNPEQFNAWPMYTTYICCLATNSGGCQGFLEKARELNPDFDFLRDVRKQYMYTAYLWNGGYWNDVFSQEDRGSVADLLGKDNLESLGGGFNITLEALQNKERRNKIIATIRKFADCMDEVVKLINANIK